MKGFEIIYIQADPFESILVEEIYWASQINKHSHNLPVIAPYCYDLGVIIMWMDAWGVFLKEGELWLNIFLLALVNVEGQAF